MFTRIHARLRKRLRAAPGARSHTRNYSCDANPAGTLVDRYTTMSLRAAIRAHNEKFSKYINIVAVLMYRVVNWFVIAVLSTATYRAPPSYGAHTSSNVYGFVHNMQGIYVQRL